MLIYCTYLKEYKPKTDKQFFVNKPTLKFYNTCEFVKQNVLIETLFTVSLACYLDPDSWGGLPAYLAIPQTKGLIGLQSRS